MAMAGEHWRVVLITTVAPVAGALAEALHGLGHEPVAVMSARRRRPGPPSPWSITDATAPPGVDVLFPRDRHSIEALMRACRPDLAVCWGYPWRIPLSALEVPRLGSINNHPAFLPRHRGPIPVSWAIREGDGSFGVTWHRMDADLDTGAILAQASVPDRDDEFSFEELGPRMLGNWWRKDVTLFVNPTGDFSHGDRDGVAFHGLQGRIHDLLFAEGVEEEAVKNG